MSGEDELAVLVLGDRSVGKSTLIASFIGRSFVSPGEHVLQDQRIPSAVPASLVLLHLVDSSADDTDLRNKLRFANVLLLAYDTSTLSSLSSLGTHWIPLIRSHCNVDTKTILLVGLRTDMDPQDQTREQSLCENLLLDFPFVQECLRCSAKTSLVDNIFRRAEMCHMYPLAPLYDVSRREFTPKCREAFKRVFRIFDRDGDGLLCDQELNKLQAVCFQDRVTLEESTWLREFLRKSSPVGVRDDKVTLDGLYQLLHKLIHKHQTHKLWAALRLHDYDDGLELDAPEFELPEPAPRQTLQLSSGALQFLRCIARYVSAAYTSSGDSQGRLTRDALEYIFSVVGESVAVPWLDAGPLTQGDTDEIPVVPAHFLCLQSHQESPHGLAVDDWLAQWHALLVHNPQRCAQLLFLLGYDDRADVGLIAADRVFVPPNLLSRMQLRRTSHSHFLSATVAVHSAPLLAALLTSLGAAPLTEEITAMATALHECGPHESLYAALAFMHCEELLQSDNAAAPDVFVLPFRNDVEGDFEQAAALETLLPPGTPRFFMCVGTAETALDGILVDSERAVQCSEDAAATKHIRERGMCPQRCLVRPLDAGLNGILEGIRQVVLDPTLACPQGKSDRMRDKWRMQVALISLTTLAAIGASYVLLRSSKRHQPSREMIISSATTGR